MKTLFIQTHELAKKLDPNRYLCAQLANFIEAQTGIDWVVSGNQGFDAFDSASLVILALVREQKEDFVASVYDSDSSRPYFYKDGLIKVDEFYLEGLIEFATDKEIRQRLINSLLTRPDRTLCVLIPE